MTLSRSKRRWLSGLILALAAAGGAAAWLLGKGGALSLPPALRALLPEELLPAHIFVANGRIEATEVDVATRLAARLVEVLVKEGDIVPARAVLARFDTANLEAQLRQAQAELDRAAREREYAEAIVEQRETERQYAARELNRLKELDERRYVAQEQVDQARTKATTAEVALRAARVQVAEAEAAIAVVQAQIDRVAADLDDSTLRAPRRGRVLYRLAEPGEVLGAGGKVLTLLDLSDVFMVLFLPETVAGRVAIGGEARLVLDAGPEYVVPARVSFVAARAQFTPKQVETRSEREKLVFRVKAHVDPDLLDRYEPLVKTGLPGVAYLNLDPGRPWPDRLQPRLPPWPTPPTSPE